MLQTFLDERGRPYRRTMSGPVSGAVHCSRLSPHLAFGTLSVREVTQVTADRQRQLKLQSDRSGWRPSLKAFQARLHWRGHFIQKLEDEPAIEYQNFHRAYDTVGEREPNAALLSAWCCGQTGLPFVDACMRALQDCGWMNFRMRAMLVSVAANHLWLDWRQPGEHLARLFTDYEPGIHWSQMQMQSGTSGINTIRIYNPVKQGHDQDPDGTFIRRWIPELAGVPDTHVHEPWRWDGAGRVLDKVYPFPVVDYLEAARSARQKVWAIRDDAAFRRAADHIQEKHGSRKSGIRQQRRKIVTKQSLPGQLSLGLDDDPA